MTHGGREALAKNGLDLVAQPTGVDHGRSNPCPGQRLQGRLHAVHGPAGGEQPPELVDRRLPPFLRRVRLAQVAVRFDHVREERAARQAMQHLGQRGMHALALAGREVACVAIMVQVLGVRQDDILAHEGKRLVEDLAQAPLALLDLGDVDRDPEDRVHLVAMEAEWNLGEVEVPRASGAVGAHPGDVDAMDTTLRVPNSITYTSPTFGGFQAGLQYGMGEQAGSMSNGSAFSAAMRYDYQAFAWSAGYIRLKNVPTFQNNTGDFANNAPINKGYATADTAQIIGTAARYTAGKLMMGLNYSNVQYKPGATSPAGFAQTASFNTFGAIATYALTPALTLAAGYSYTAENKRNGVDKAARYHQISMEQLYSFSKRTAFYMVEAYQKASGQTLSSTGSIVNAVASVGDSQNGTPSSGPSQFVGMVGIRHFF